MVKMLFWLCEIGLLNCGRGGVREKSWDPHPWLCNSCVSFGLRKSLKEKFLYFSPLFFSVPEPLARAQLNKTRVMEISMATKRQFSAYVWVAVCVALEVTYKHIKVIHQLGELFWPLGWFYRKTAQQWCFLRIDLITVNSFHFIKR